MGITSSTKFINKETINCDGTLSVTLALSATPNIAENPADIVLILDRSNSMRGEPLTNMKKGANAFIDIIDEASNGVLDGNIGNGSRIGIVSFSNVATQDTQLITSTQDLKNAVNDLAAGGNTNHADAFSEAVQLFDFASPNQKIMVMFTDGKTTVGANPTPVAIAAKDAGIIIYCIGLIGENGIDVAELAAWASEPASSYVAVTPDAGDLEELFVDLVQNITKPGATDIVIDEIINPDFKILEIEQTNKGKAEIINDTKLQWKIDELGVKGNEGASLTFLIEHISTISGTKEVNESISYNDNENNSVNFPSPKVYVECGIDIFPEKCPTPINMVIDACKDSIEFDAGEITLNSSGQIAQINLTLKNVCPHKRVALAVFLQEKGIGDTYYNRGLKTMTIPARNYSMCKDISVKCIKFVLPEDTYNDIGVTTGMCQKRQFRVNLIAHYIDTDFVCCPKTTNDEI